MVVFSGASFHRRNVALKINQGAKDDAALSLQSSDVVTGLTSQAETETWLRFQKLHAAEGGADIKSVAEDAAVDVVTRISSFGGTADTTKTTAGRSLVEINVAEHDGANTIANITANGNVWGVRARVGGTTLTRALVDADGDFFSVTAAQTFDAHDDAALLDSYDRVRSGNGTPAEEQELIRLGILVAPLAEGGFTNQTQLMRLVVGNARQMAAKALVTEQKIAALEQPPAQQGI